MMLLKEYDRPAMQAALRRVGETMPLDQLAELLEFARAIAEEGEQDDQAVAA